MKVRTENDNNLGYEKNMILVDNIPLRLISKFRPLRNNKQHVVLGQKRKCQRMQESGL
jgi:hypothetical protein